MRFDDLPERPERDPVSVWKTNVFPEPVTPSNVW
jgi:hypothetical protein